MLLRELNKTEYQRLSHREKVNYKRKRKALFAFFGLNEQSWAMLNYKFLPDFRSEKVQMIMGGDILGCVNYNNPYNIIPPNWEQG